MVLVSFLWALLGYCRFLPFSMFLLFLCVLCTRIKSSLSRVVLFILCRFCVLCAWGLVELEPHEYNCRLRYPTVFMLSDHPLLYCHLVSTCAQPELR